MTDDIDEIVQWLRNLANRRERAWGPEGMVGCRFNDAADALGFLNKRCEQLRQGLEQECAEVERLKAERDELKSIGDGIAEVLETNGYAHMTNPNGISSILEELNAERARAEAAEKELAELRKQLVKARSALKPFALAADATSDEPRGLRLDNVKYEKGQLTVTDLRAAKAAMTDEIE